MNDVQIARDLAAVSESVKSAHHRLDEQGKVIGSIHDMAACLKEILVEMKHMRRDIDELKCEVEAQKAKPGKRWEALVGQLLTLITAAVAGGFLSRLL